MILHIPYDFKLLLIKIVSVEVIYFIISLLNNQIIYVIYEFQNYLNIIIIK